MFNSVHAKLNEIMNCGSALAIIMNDGMNKSFCLVNCSRKIWTRVFFLLLCARRRAINTIKIIVHTKFIINGML